MVQKTLTSLREFYNVFRSGLTSAEIEKLLSNDARGMYSFYVRNMQPGASRGSKIGRVIRFTWYLFLAFLQKLTPARRLFYAIALLLMGLAFWDDDLMKALYGFVILNFLLALELADKLVTRDELEFARQIQLSLLPDSLIPVPGFSLDSFTEVAESVGGDYYDLIPRKDGSTFVVVGDVSGKGISAALYMVKVQTALQLLAMDAADPRQLMIRLNEYLYGKFRRNFFLTITIAQLFPNGKVMICRAGHMPGLLFDSQQRVCQWIQPRGTAIGLAPADSAKGNGKTNATFERSLEMERLSLQKGDVLILFTDGVVESVNRQQEEFGEARLMQALLDSGQLEVEGIKERIVGRLGSFRSGAELRDDTTFVILKRNGLT